MMDITQTALLLSLNISVWDAGRTDSKVSEEVAKRHNTQAGRAGHYYKYRIDPKAPTYVAAKQAATKLRDYHYERTLPWSDGWQVLNAAAFMEYAEGFRRLESGLLVAARAFTEDYPRLKANAKVELNGLYKESDYPEPEEVLEAFGVRLRKMEIPRATDLRVKMSEEFVEQLAKDIKADVQDSLEGAMQRAWERLRERVAKLAASLSEKDRVFRDSLVENLRAECALLASLNITGDERLDQLRFEAEALIKGISAQALREDVRLRTKVATEASALQSRMAAYMGA